MIRRLDQFSDENSSKYRNDGRERFRRTRTRLFPASFIPGNESAKPHRSIDRPSSNDAIDATVSAAAAVVVPPESTLHEFTADSETTRSLSRNTALRPIFVRLPRFVNDKGSNRERYFPSRDQSLHGLLRTGKRFLSRQTSPISDSTRGNGTRERKRERDIYVISYIYIYCLIWTEGYRTVEHDEDITFILKKANVITSRETFFIDGYFAGERFLNGD